jgi:hypothetical protein
VPAAPARLEGYSGHTAERVEEAAPADLGPAKVQDEVASTVATLENTALSPKAGSDAEPEDSGDEPMDESLRLLIEEGNDSEESDAAAGHVNQCSDFLNIFCYDSTIYLLFLWF